jgi:hypothetical protein
MVITKDQADTIATLFDESLTQITAGK